MRSDLNSCHQLQIRKNHENLGHHQCIASFGLGSPSARGRSSDLPHRGLPTSGRAAPNLHPKPCGGPGPKLGRWRHHRCDRGGADRQPTGGRDSKGIAAMAGVIGGAVLGDKVETQGNNTQPTTTCTTQTVYENRLTGYNVVYEYAGKQYNVQLPQDPDRPFPFRSRPWSPRAPKRLLKLITLLPLLSQNRPPSSPSRAWSMCPPRFTATTHLFTPTSTWVGVPGIAMFNLTTPVSGTVRGAKGRAPSAPPRPTGLKCGLDLPSRASSDALFV